MLIFPSISSLVYCSRALSISLLDDIVAGVSAVDDDEYFANADRSGSRAESCAFDNVNGSSLDGSVSVAMIRLLARQKHIATNQFFNF